MPRKGRSNEEIIHALHQVEGGEKVTEVCRRLGVSEQTFYRWKKRFGALGVSARSASCANCGRKIASSKGVLGSGGVPVVRASGLPQRWGHRALVRYRGFSWA